MSLACVVLPDPGGPITKILGGLFGAFDLKTRPIIFLISAVIYSGDLGSSAGCSKMN